MCTVKSTDTNTESTSWERYALYLNSILKAHNISVQTFEDFVFSSVPEQSSPGEKEETVTERQKVYLTIPGDLITHE